MKQTIDVHDTNSTTIATADLAVGQTNDQDLFDATGTLMLRQGVLVTGLLIGKLLRNGVETLHKEASPISDGPITEPATAAEAEVAGGGDAESIEAKEYRDVVTSALKAYPPEKMDRINGWIESASSKIEGSLHQLLESGKPDWVTTDAVVNEAVNEITDEADPVVARTLIREMNLDLARRSIQFSMLAVAVGLQMRLSEREISELGRVALIHDAMLYKLPVEERFPHHARDDNAQQIYMQHPLVAQKMLLSGATTSATMATMAAQVHERLDGTGFPRGCSADLIHPLSRILSVIDTYLTLTSPPTGFPRIVPADAVAHLVSGMSSGKFSPTAVCGLLETISLHPLGSLFELSDASQVRSIHTNGQDYGYPIMQDISDASRKINLKETDLFVTRPILVPSFQETRLPDVHRAA